MCCRGIARHLMQKMGFDFKNPSGLGLNHAGPITPVGANFRPKFGPEVTRNPGLGFESSTHQVASANGAKPASLVGVNRALDNVAVRSHKLEPVRVIGKKTARESNEQILVVGEMLKQKQASLSKLGREATHHPEQLKHLVDGKIKHMQSEIDDLKRAAEEAIRIAQLKTANKKLKKVAPFYRFILIIAVIQMFLRARTYFNPRANCLKAQRDGRQVYSSHASMSMLCSCGPCSHVLTGTCSNPETTS